MIANVKQRLDAWIEKNWELIRQLGWAFVIFYLVKALIYIAIIVWASHYF